VNQPTIRLACGHQRTTGLLPAKGISIEQMETRVGRRLFPPDDTWFAQELPR
jgi:hypothetical protein